MDTITGVVKLKLVDANLLLGIDSKGQTVPIGKNLDREPEWWGIKASDMLLLSAAACSVYDVINILKKQKQRVRDLEISCSGEQLAEPPYTFVSMHIEYKVKGDVDAGKLERAVQLSEEKYCSVISTLRSGLKITSSTEIINE
ncbi:MAG: OsmC family protein [Anaerolineales bacterium]|jgi:putative redox protein